MLCAGVMIATHLLSYCTLFNARKSSNVLVVCLKDTIREEVDEPIVKKENVESLQILQECLIMTLDPQYKDKDQDISFVYLYNEPEDCSSDKSIYNRFYSLKKDFDGCIEMVGCDYVGHNAFLLCNQVRCLYYNHHDYYQHRERKSIIPTLNNRICADICINSTLYWKRHRTMEIRRSMPLDYRWLPDDTDRKLTIKDSIVSIQSSKDCDQSVTLDLRDGQLEEDLKKDLIQEMSLYNNLIVIFCKKVTGSKWDIIFINRYTQKYYQKHAFDSYYLVILC